MGGHIKRSALASGLQWGIVALNFQPMIDFASHPRYRILEPLGTGGMGIVYRAFDQHLGGEVALKTLRGTNTLSHQHLKAEFRAIAGIVHPNLVALYELELGPDGGFFTMEIINGVDIVAHLREKRIHAEGGAYDAHITTILGALAEGIHALHRTGHIHCDIKPSNVLVERSGRVVVLDFGIATQTDGFARDAPLPPTRMGTKGYASPEQMAGRPLTTASDWYSFGVILHQVLTGRLPADPSETFEHRIAKDPPPPRTVCPDVPDHLNILCWKLLRRNPVARPDFDEIMEMLRGTVGAQDEQEFTEPTVFVGRQNELAQLHEAFASVCRGHPATVHVQGPSGIGKSSLLDRFLNNIGGNDGVMVLRGRCYERETIPYKAIDALMDALVQQLLTLRSDELARLLPPDASLLGRVFPSFGRLALHETMALNPDLASLRRRTFQALRELFYVISQEKRIVVAIDDMQWADVEDGWVLEEIFQQSPQPNVLLILSFRNGDIETSSVLQRLVPWKGAFNITLTPLGTDECIHLASTLLGAALTAVGLPLDTFAVETNGNPFLIRELARDVRASVAAQAILPTTFGGLRASTAKRMNQLGDDSRKLLEIVAVAGYPLGEQIATHAADLRDGHLALAMLRSSQLVISRATERGSLLEPYHDRIREGIVARLSESDRQGWHRRLAEVLRNGPEPDPLRLLEHYEGSGDLDQVHRYATLAGDHAMRSLAFHRAAQLFRRALQCSPFESPDGHEKLATALSNAGHSGEAARHFSHAADLRTAQSSADAIIVDLRRRAAEHYLRSGFIEQGLTSMRDVLVSVGTDLPKHPWQSTLSVLWRRPLVALQMKAQHGPRQTNVSTEDLTKLEAYWSAGLGLSMIDTIRSADFQIRHQMLAAHVQDPTHVARSLASYGAFLASEGGAPKHEQASFALKKAQKLAIAQKDPNLDALVNLCQGVAKYFRNDWRGAQTALHTAEELCRERCSGVAWEMANAQLYGAWALVYLGRLAEIAKRIPRAISEATERGDIFAATSLRLGLPNVMWLVADKPLEARKQIDEAMRNWPGLGFHTQHYFEVVARTNVDLYEGQAWTAWTRIERIWPKLVGSFLLSLQQLRVELKHLRARAALAAANSMQRQRMTSPLRTLLLARASLTARQLASEDLPSARPLAATLRAGIANIMGDRAAAMKHLDSALWHFGTLDMILHKQATMYWRGELAADKQGREDVAQSMVWMQSEGVVSPRRLASLFVPGFGSSG